jgi:ribosomal protein S14
MHREIYAHRSNRDRYVLRNIAPPSSCTGIIHRAEVSHRAADAQGGVGVDLGICRITLRKITRTLWLIAVDWSRPSTQRVFLERLGGSEVERVELIANGCERRFTKANLVCERDGVRVAVWCMYFD